MYEDVAEVWLRVLFGDFIEIFGAQVPYFAAQKIIAYDHLQKLCCRI